MKADDKVKYEDEEKPQKYTYFEEVAARLEVAIETIDKHADILRSNNLTMETTEHADGVDADKAYRMLEED